MAEFEFSDEPRGGIGMTIRADSRYEVYDASIGALGLLMWGKLERTEAMPIVWYGFDDVSLAVALINEMLYQHQLKDFCFAGFRTERIEEVEELDEKVWKGSAKQLKIFGTAFGVFDPERKLVMRQPVYAALLPGAKFRRRDDGRFEMHVILDDVGGDFEGLPEEWRQRD